MPTTSLIPSPMIGAGDVSNAEHAFLNSVTSNVQTQISAAGGFTLGTEQATTSGTGVTFGSIPAGTKIIHILMEGVSFSGTDHCDVQIGDAGGIEGSGYVSTFLGSQDNNDDIIVQVTDAFGLYFGVAANLWSGIITLMLKDSSNFTWICSHTGKGSAITSVGAGDKSLSAELTQVKISPAGSNTMDAGSINIVYL